MLIQFYMAHKTEILLYAAYVFSAVMSTMPPLPESTPYFLRWIHDALQVLAANPNKAKLQQPKAN